MSSKHAARFKLPPGLPPVLKHTGINCLPAVFVVAGARALSAAGGMNIGIVWIALAALLSIPFVYVGRIVYKTRSYKWRAAAMGAVMPRERVGKRIGNLDLLQEGIEAFRHGYLGACSRAVDLGRTILTLACCYAGDGLWGGLEEYGPLHSVSLLWEPIYLTTDANVLKVRICVWLARCWCYAAVLKETCRLSLRRISLFSTKVCALIRVLVCDTV